MPPFVIAFTPNNKCIGVMVTPCPNAAVAFSTGPHVLCVKPVSVLPNSNCKDLLKRKRSKNSFWAPSGNMISGAFIFGFFLPFCISL